MNSDYKIRFNPGEEGEYQSHETNPKPIEKPKNVTEFKRVYGKQDKEGKEKDLASKKKGEASKIFESENEPAAETEVLVEEPDKDNQENASGGIAPSLFDLSKTSKKQDSKPISPFKHDKAAELTDKEHQQIESPSDMFKRLSSKDKHPSPQHHSLETTESARPSGHSIFDLSASEHPARSASDSTTDSTQKIEKSFKQEKYTTRYTPEQPDLTYVNPLITPAQVQETLNTDDIKKIERPVPVEMPLQELVNQIVKHMYTVESLGKTETVIILQHPPLFKDAHIVVTAFDSARGEFNISFENLTQAAQRVLDLESNRKALVAALEEKGYGVQILQTTTVDAAPFAEQAESAQQGSEDRSGSEQEQSKNRQEQEEF